ncbi:MAG: sigma-70 family RNA polymerase sigma factor [Elusimicrobiota bacterium]
MEESEIIRKIKSGEKQLFEKIILKHQDFIFKAVYSLVKTEAQAQDLTQEVLLKAYENIEKFEEKAKLSSWLYRIAYNLSVNWLEREKDKESQFPENAGEIFEETADLQDAAFEKAETTALIMKSFENLEEKHRIILKLRYLEDKSYQEIAYILNMPINTVKIKILRAKKALSKAANYS